MFLLNKDPELSRSCNNHGTSPLHVLLGNTSMRLQSCFEPLLEILLMFGADPNGKDVDGCTPLVIASAHRDWASCQTLLIHGADMNVPFLMSSRTLRSNSDLWKLSDLGVDLPDTGLQECTASDLIPLSSRVKLFQYISVWQSRIAPHSRDRCMNCATSFQDKTKKMVRHSCLHCGRIVCAQCSITEMSKSALHLPEFLGNVSPSDHQICKTCFTGLSH